MFKLIVLFAVMSCAIANPVARDLNSTGTEFDSSFVEGMQFDFDLNQEEMDNFEFELGGITAQLFGDWRIFEVVRALVHDEGLRNDTLKYLKTIANDSYSKSAIYEAVKAANQKLQETEGKSTEFATTDEEITKFRNVMDQIVDQLFAQKKVFIAIRALATDSNLSDTIEKGLDAIILGDDPKTALFDAATFVNDKLQQVGSVEDFFGITEEESEKFDEAFEELRVEFLEKRRVYEVIRALVIDEKLRNETVEKLIAIAVGENPKAAFFDALEALRFKMFE